MRASFGSCLGVSLALIVALFAASQAPGQAPARTTPLRPQPAVLDRATPELLERLRTDRDTYFRFVNRAWTAKSVIGLRPCCRTRPSCSSTDAHVEQYDYESGVGPRRLRRFGAWAIPRRHRRFLGSVELVARQRGWSRLDRLFDRFFEGYRRGLEEPAARPPEPDRPDFERPRRAIVPRISRGASRRWSSCPPKRARTLSRVSGSLPDAPIKSGRICRPATSRSSGSAGFVLASGARRPTRS